MLSKMARRTVRPAVPLEERLSDQSAEFYKALDQEKKDRVRELVTYIRKYPGVDGVRVFYRATEEKTFNVLVDPDYTIWFRPDGNRVWIDLIQNTSVAVRQAAYS